MLITSQQILDAVALAMWPFVRITGVCMVAPVIGGRMVPVRVRIIFSAVLTLIVVPLVDMPPPPMLGLGAIIVAVRELAVGLAIGFLIQMVFDAMVIGGQTIAMSMGLGFATMVDPQRGNMPVLSHFYVLIATLLFLALNAHLALLGVLVDSFRLLPPGAEGLSAERAWDLVGFGSRMFAGAMQMALPAVASLLVVNLAFGVMSRAAPNLNLFAVGFPVTLLLGFVILAAGVGNIAPVLESLLSDALSLAAALSSGD